MPQLKSFDSVFSIVFSVDQIGGIKDLQRLCQNNCNPGQEGRVGTTNLKGIKTFDLHYKAGALSLSLSLSLS
jgi:hypothetical protein